MVVGASAKTNMYGLISQAYEGVGLQPSTISVSVLDNLYVIGVGSDTLFNPDKEKFYRDTYNIPIQGGTMHQNLVPLVAGQKSSLVADPKLNRRRKTPDRLEDKLLTARENVARACGVEVIVAPPIDEWGMIARMFGRNGFSLGSYEGKTVWMKHLTPSATN